MITTQLLRPESIVVVGASNNVHKPGGAILKNLINGGYQGELRAVNPKETEVQGVPAFADVKELPDTDLAVLAVPAVMCPDIVETLASEKQTRAFIILSAGFGEETREGALLEERILETVNKYGASLIGPNCIGLMNTWHHSVFSQPIPNLNSKGVDLISSSGATAVFILESAVTKGLQFNSVWSVGNAKQIGVEDVLQFIATNIKSNIRELEGSLNKLIALYKLKNEEINISLAAEALKDLISPDENRKITPELIIETVSEHFGISVSDLKSASRDAKTTNARHIAMYLCRAMTDTPLKTVGSLLGGRDHSTVKHGVDKMSKDMENNDSLKNTISIIQKKISPL